MKLLSKFATFVLILACLRGAQAQNYETTLTGTISDTTGANVDLSSPEWMREPVKSNAIREGILAF